MLPVSFSALAQVAAADAPPPVVYEGFTNWGPLIGFVGITVASFWWFLREMFKKDDASEKSDEKK